MAVASLCRSLVGVTAVAALAGAATVASPQQADAAFVFEGPVAPADCGPGSSPETGLQGQVPLEDRESGRSQEGYWCNLELVGQHQGIGAGWQMDWYEDCAYYDTTSPGVIPNLQGAVALDVSDPANPTPTTYLTTPAMFDPHESLKVNERRGLLAGVAGQDPVGNGPLYFDVYDVSQDCSQPELLASAPILNGAGHEGDWAPDGLTYYGAGLAGADGGIFAIDVTDPTNPSLITSFESTHGLSISDDGNRAYTTGASCGNGMAVVDVSEIQAREPDPQVTVVGEVCWPDGATAQHTIPVTIDGHPYVVFVDEGGWGAARLIDIADETAPVVVSKFKLEIHMPEHREAAEADIASNGIFGYEGHYCSVDRRHEPTALACGYMQSGIRVFDIRDPYAPREIAYSNPPAQVGRGLELTGSEHNNNPVSWISGGPPDLTADWCSAQVRLVPETGELWSTCQDNGLLILRFTNGVWPFPEDDVDAPPSATTTPNTTTAGTTTTRARLPVRHGF